MKKIAQWVLGVVGVLILTFVLLDTLGGFFLDGPLGPIPGGALQGPVNGDADPDWAALNPGKVIELEIRPHRPWSLSVWNAVVDGELYVPSAFGARRRWTKVVIEDPRVRVRIGDQIFEQRAVKVGNRETRKRVAQAFADRYDLGDPDRDITSWFFHLTER